MLADRGRERLPLEGDAWEVEVIRESFHVVGMSDLLGGSSFGRAWTEHAGGQGNRMQVVRGRELGIGRDGQDSFAKRYLHMVAIAPSPPSRPSALNGSPWHNYFHTAPGVLKHTKLSRRDPHAPAIPRSSSTSCLLALPPAPPVQSPSSAISLPTPCPPPSTRSRSTPGATRAPMRRRATTPTSYVISLPCFYAPAHPCFLGRPRV